MTMVEWKVTFYNKHCSYGPPIFLLVAADTEDDAVKVAEDHTLNRTTPEPPFHRNRYFELVKVEPYNRPNGYVIGGGR